MEEKGYHSLGNEEETYFAVEDLLHQKGKIMSYFIVCTFDLEDGSSEDYKNAYLDLEGIGLSHSIESSARKLIELPSTTTAGEFEGDNAASVRDEILNAIKVSFKKRGFTSAIFVSCGGDWGWAHSTT